MSASEWAARIKEIAPADIRLKEVEASDDYAILIGEAKSTSAIALLMRSIDEADLGAPELQQATRNGEISEFTLRVRIRRSPSMLSPAR